MMLVAGGYLASVVWMASRLLVPAAASAPTVDLGYATYHGYYNDAHGLNIWKSIRYAAPPLGKLRWQAPQVPPWNNSRVTLAVEQPPICPQTGAFGVPEAYGFNSGPGDEDCLYLNVYAAPEASHLPVLVWIHGGGYSLFGANYDPSVWMNTNGNAFVTVEIQYRLGAFGFLASADIKEKGRVNVGLLDQRFALEWVQEHISKFGGDPERVTIAGESSGAGSVMYHALAYGGGERHLFNNIIAASPYSPEIYRYSDPIPAGNYEAFAAMAGCGPDSAQINQYSSVFDCLVAADSTALQNASGTVSTTRGYFGSFAFLPVIDDEYIQQQPATQLLLGNVSGKRILVGNNANDGVPLTKPDITTREEYNDFISTTFPWLTPSQVASLNEVYHIDNFELENDGTRYDTLGDSGPTALNQSEMATGIQQSVFNMAAEAIFDCPAHWLTEGFSREYRQAWKYQYSVTPAYHGHDLSAYFSVGVKTPNEDFRHAFQKMLGNFVINDTPIIPIADVTVNYSNATVPLGTNGNIDWPEFSPSEPWQMDLNTTGGTVTNITVPPYLSYYERLGPGIVNTFRLVNAWNWEGGRGERCALWRTAWSRDAKQ